MPKQFQTTIEWFRSQKEKKSTYERKGIRPAKDWQRILTVAFALLSILGAGSAYFYMEVSNGRLFITEQDNTEREIKINRKLLSNLSLDALERKSSSLSLTEGSNIPPDPSI